MRTFRPFVLLLLLLSAMACATGAPTSAPPAPTPAPPQAPAPQAAPEPGALGAALPIDPAIRRGHLDNGLLYFIRHHERPKERAELRLVVNTGSLQEDDDQQGFAHFVEHMAFNGTEHFKKQELVDYLESIGMRFGADLNASTSFDETIYELTVPTDDAEILAKAFLILDDWAHGVAFEDEEIDKERGVVIEEWRLDRGAAARARDRQFPVLFRGSRYPERMPIGQKETLENGSHEALRRYYRDWYRPDLMAVIAVGDFDVDVIEDLIRRHFEPIPAAQDPRDRRVYPVPDHEETLSSFFTDPELTQTLVSVYYKLPRPPEGTYGDYRRLLLEGVYNGLVNDRLYEVAQRADPPFLGAFAGKSDLVRSRAVFSQAAAVQDGGVRRGLRALLTEVERIDRHGFTAGELERKKKDVLRGYEQAFRERDKRHSANLAAEYGRHFLIGEPIPGIELELDLARRFLPTIEVEEVNRLASEWITRDNRVILVTGPEKEGTALPTEAEVLDVFAEVEASDIEPWVDQVLDEPLVTDLPEPGAVTEEGTIDELGVTWWRLANGVRVVLKPTDFRNDQVLLNGFSPGGTSLVEDDRYPSARFATAILEEGGLGNFSQIELNKALAGKVAGAGAFIGELQEGVSGSASPQDLETMLQLVYLTFTAPRFDPATYQSLRTRLETFVENRLSRPETVFGDRWVEVLSQGHPRRRPLTPEVLGEIDPEVAMAVYRDRFAEASDFTFVVVGNFEPAGIRNLVETYLGGLPAAGREETWRDIGLRRPGGVERFEVRKGLEPKSQVRLVFTTDAPWSREASEDISTLGRVLTVRLREILREDLGGTYGVGVGGDLQRRPYERSSVSISFGCAPEEAVNLVDAVFAEIDRIRTEGIEERYLDKVHEAQRRQREVDLRENGFWLGKLADYYAYDEDPRLILGELDRALEVTPERVQEAAKRFLVKDRYVLGIHYPEAGTGSEPDRE